MAWAGSFYSRQRGKQTPNWRNRNSGVILKNEPRVIRKKGRNFVVASSNPNILGVEKTGQHFFNSDPRNKSQARIIYQKRIRSRRELRAIHAKLRNKR